MLLYDDLSIKQRAFFLQYLWNGVGNEMLQPPSFIFSKASEYHDFASFRGGNEALRQASVKEFFHKAHEAVRQQPIWKRPLYYFISYIYYWALQKIDRVTWSYFPEPAKDWSEFIDRVVFYYETVQNREAPQYVFDARKIK